jgi:hypothetical protein
MITMSFAVFVSAVAAQKQTVSYSGTECWLYSGKEYAKIWMQADPGNLKSRSERIDEKTGEKSIIIYRQDSAKMFVLKPEKKTYIALATSQMNLNDLVGLDVEKNRTVEREFLGTEKLKNGYECHHYISKSTSVLKNGTQETGCFEYWEYEPLNVQMQHKIACGYDEPILLTNFRQGAQPAHLFEIPKDYKGMYLPEGGLLEMFTGKSKEDNQKAVDDARKSMEDLGDKFKEIEKKPKDEQLQEYFKLLNDSQKKK